MSYIVPLRAIRTRAIIECISRNFLIIKTYIIQVRENYVKVTFLYFNKFIFNNNECEKHRN